LTLVRLRRLAGEKIEHEVYHTRRGIPKNQLSRS
jgi:hypothetical protein